MIILLKVLQKKIGNIGLRSQASFLIKIILSSIFLGIGCVLVNNYLGSVLNLNNKFNQIIQTIASILTGSMVYYISSYIFGIPEIRSLKQNIKIILKGRS
jgi:putative peptidoglycan lipid II flippase